MKRLRILSIIFLYSNCRSVDRKTDLIATFTIKPGTKIEVVSGSLDAASPGFTDIKIMRTGRSQVLKRIDGSYLNFKTQLVRVNDTLYRVTFTDTSEIRGLNVSYNVSLNEHTR